VLCVPGAVNADTTEPPTVPRNASSTTSNANQTRPNTRRRRGDPRRGGPGGALGGGAPSGAASLRCLPWVVIVMPHHPPATQSAGNGGDLD